MRRRAGKPEIFGFPHDAIMSSPDGEPFALHSDPPHKPSGLCGSGAINRAWEPGGRWQ